MNDPGSPFIDTKVTADAAKGQLDEFSKTLVFPVPLLVTLIGVLAGGKPRVQFLGAEFSRSVAVLAALAAVVVLSAHCCRLLSALVTITRIHPEKAVKAALRFHPGLFNPFIMAWPKSAGGWTRWLVWPSIWIALCTGRLGALFVLALPVGISTPLTSEQAFSNLRRWSDLVAFLVGPTSMLVLVLAISLMRQIDKNISDPDVPKERWQSVCGVVFGYAVGSLAGWLVAQRE